MIQVSDLSYTYPGNSTPAIHDIHFQIHPGEIFGFLGPNGAGKTTTQNILIGVLKGYKGSVTVLEEDLNQISPDFYQHIGVAFEYPNFFTKFTALENLKYFQALYSGETVDPMHLLEMVDLAENADTRVGAFSKGMRMRLNFCRTFLHNPELVFLDEPNSGLDPVNARKMKDLILEKKSEGLTVFLTTHNMQVADDLCDRVGFLVDGQIVLIDSPRELKVKNGRKTVRVEYRENGALHSEEFALHSLGDNTQFFEIIRTKDIETLHTQEATLEDIFIRTTGRSLS